MMGKIGSREFTCGCCDWSRGKRAQKALETRQWQYDTWLESLEHHGEACPYDDHGCIECWDFDYDYNDNSDLDDVPGVWCNVDWRNKYEDWELELLGIPKPQKPQSGWTSPLGWNG
jgi:hypothetical protein